MGVPILAIAAMAVQAISAIDKSNKSKKARAEAEKEHQRIINSDIWDDPKAAVEMAEGLHLEDIKSAVSRGISERTGSAIDMLRGQGARGVPMVATALESQNKAEREAGAMFTEKEGQAQGLLANIQRQNNAAEQSYMQGHLAGINQLEGELRAQSTQNIADMFKTAAAADWGDDWFSGGGGSNKTGGATGDDATYEEMKSDIEYDLNN